MKYQLAATKNALPGINREVTHATYGFPRSDPLNTICCSQPGRHDARAKIWGVMANANYEAAIDAEDLEAAETPPLPIMALHDGHRATMRRASKNLN